MSCNSIRVFVANLVCFSIASNRLTTLICRNCRSPLDIHQPNPHQPDQFLGTCPECDCWFRIEARSGEGRATVLQLPEMGEIIPPASPSGSHS